MERKQKGKEGVMSLKLTVGCDGQLMPVTELGVEALSCSPLSTTLLVTTLQDHSSRRAGTEFSEGFPQGKAHMTGINVRRGLLGGLKPVRYFEVGLCLPSQGPGLGKMPRDQMKPQESQL